MNTFYSPTMSTSSSHSSVYPDIQVTHTAPSNIACIKYWGKRDIRMNTPINSSVSVTMNQDDLKAITTITASKEFNKDQLWLNGHEEDITKNNRVQEVLKEIRKRCRDRTTTVGKDKESSIITIPAEELRTWKVRIVSRNTFPTAAGLASSAAGYACLVHTLADVYNVTETYKGELSTIARQGSGSACRSLYGGFVEWSMGTRVDGSDSLAVQIADEHHWPELSLLIAVVSDKKKDTGSTDGMVRSVATSPLLKHRSLAVVPERLTLIEKAYRNKDFTTFATLTMQDSNQFHAACLDTFPPIFYMNDISKRVISLVHKINEVAGSTIAGYTFDAGPNAVIFTLKPNVAHILAVLLANFPLDSNTSTGMEGPFVSNAAVYTEAQTLVTTLPSTLANPSTIDTSHIGAIRHIYVTSVGDGPRILNPSDSLANTEGLPLIIATSKNTEFDKGL